MNKILLFFVIIVFYPVLQIRAQDTYTITSSGYSFVPAELNVVVGDTVIFNVGATHTARQVSMATWYADGTDALSGGFDFATGSGVFVPSQADTVYYVCSYHVSLGMKGKIAVSAPSSVRESARNTEPEIYPNPASDVIYLNSPASSPPSLIAIYDMTGKEMRTIKSPGMENHQIMISISDLHQGLYFVRLKYPGKSYVLKFVKM